MVWGTLDSFVPGLRRGLGGFSKGTLFYLCATTAETPRAGTFPVGTRWKSTVPFPPETRSYLGFRTGLQTCRLMAEQHEEKI